MYSCEMKRAERTRAARPSSADLFVSAIPFFCLIFDHLLCPEDDTRPEEKRLESKDGPRAAAENAGRSMPRT